MKTKLFLAGAIAVLAVSCTKDYTCTCTSTSQSSLTGTQTEIDTYQVNEATKDEAVAACNGATVVDSYVIFGETVTTTKSCSLAK